MRPTAVPLELIRSWEEPGQKPVSLMLRREVPQFRTEFLNRAVHLFNTWRLFEKAPPCGNGWANERNVTCRILTILAVEDNKYDAWQRELENAKKR